MSAPAVPLRTEPSVWARGGLKNRAGTLLLYPDRLVHVGSKAAQFGRGFGVIGLLVTQGVANARAAGRAASGGKSVETILLSSISEVHGEKARFFGRFLVVRTTAGDVYRFGGVKFDNWSDDLNRALSAAGRRVARADGALSVN